MSEIETISKNGTNALRRLRERKLRNGKPFMININDLDNGKSYLEYPDGKIKLVKIDSASRKFTVIRQLTSLEVALLRLSLDIKPVM